MKRYACYASVIALAILFSGANKLARAAVNNAVVENGSTLQNVAPLDSLANFWGQSANAQTSSAMPASTPAANVASRSIQVAPGAENGGEPLHSFYTTSAQTFNGSECQAFANPTDIFDNGFTISVELSLSSERFRHIILSQEVENDRGLLFLIQEGKPALQIYSSDTDSEFVIAEDVLPLNQWIHLTARYDNGTVSITVNGLEVAQQNAVPAIRDTTAPTRFGCYQFNNTFSWYLDGEMRNLHLYDIAATVEPAITPEPTKTPDGGGEPQSDVTYTAHAGTPELYDGGRCTNIVDDQDVFANNWTFSAYVNLLEGQERHPVMAKQGNMQRGILLSIDSGELILELYRNATDFTEVRSGQQLPLNKWTHIAVQVKDGSAMLWIDGLQVAAQTNVGAVADNELDLQLGCYEWDSDELRWYFYGQIQDAIFLNRATEIEPGPAPENTPVPVPDPLYQLLADESSSFTGTECEGVDDSEDLFAGNWTVELQFRMSQTQFRHPLFSDMMENHRGIFFGIEQDELDKKRKLAFEIYSDNFTDNGLIVDTDVSVGEWHHASVSFSNGIVRIYLDGQMVASQTNVPAVQANSAPLRVGCYIYNGQNAWYFTGELGNVRFYRGAVSVQPGSTPTATADPLAPTPQGFERGRVRIVGNNIVADNDSVLRGEHVVFANGTSPGPEDSNGWNLERLYDKNLWRVIRDDYRLNTVRLMMSRPPQNWFGGPGSSCSPPGYRCYSLDYTHPNGKTTLQIMDDMVNIAAQLGMYVVIDYHPVLGIDPDDAKLWWARVAPRYKDHTHVIYELANEPYSNTGYPGDLVDLEEELFAQVRADAPETHIVLWSFPNTAANMANQVNVGTQISYSNASVGFHPYDDYQNIYITSLRDSFPVFATEIGANRLDRVKDMEEMGVSWIGLDNIQGLPGLSGEPDTHSADQIFWNADPAAVDQINQPQEANIAPEIDSIADLHSWTSSPVSLQVSARDDDNDLLIFTIIGQPDGLTIDTASGLITGEVGLDSMGTYSVTVSVSDGTESASTSFVWMVEQGVFIPLKTR